MASPTANPFPFTKLSDELQLLVLEHVDWISFPSDGYSYAPIIHWCPQRRLQACQHKALKAHDPTSLFLVSKAFKAKALEVFWKRNIFQVKPNEISDQDREKDTSKPSLRYAASEFLTRPMPSSSMRYIRFLSLEDFGIAPAKQYARDDWFRSLGIALEGGLNLKKIYVAIDEEKTDMGLELNRTRFFTAEENIKSIRATINEKIWPWRSGKTLAGITKELVLYVKKGNSGDSGCIRYMLRTYGNEAEEKKLAHARREYYRRDSELEMPDGTKQRWVEELLVSSTEDSRPAGMNASWWYRGGDRDQNDHKLREWLDRALWRERGESSLS